MSDVAVNEKNMTMKTWAHLQKVAFDDFWICSGSQLEVCLELEFVFRYDFDNNKIFE